MILSQAKLLVPDAVKHYLASWRREYSGKFFTQELLGQTIEIIEVDAFSRGWYDRPWSLQERNEFRFLKTLPIKEDATVFNCGAHQGVVAILLKRVLAAKGRVIAVEVDAVNCSAISANARQNGDEGIVPVHAALAEKSGQVSYSGRSNSTLTSMGSAFDFLLPRVDSVTLDQLSEEFGFPDLVYLDVEGAEALAMRSAGLTLKNTPHWFVELHGDEACGRFGGSNADVVEIFSSSGFRIFTAKDEQEDFLPLKKVTGERMFMIATKGSER
jgi:FkbM family methyltransferase